MRESQRANLLIVLSLAAIIGSMAVYASILLSWLRKGSGPTAPAPPAVSADLAAARKAFRARILDARGALELSEALYRAHRAVDSFYVEDWAQSFYGPSEFSKAHDEVVLRKEPLPISIEPGDPKASLKQVAQALAGSPEDRALLCLKAQLLEPSDPSDAIGLYARLVSGHPDTYEAGQALGELRRLAAVKDEGPSEAADDAREALQELMQARPEDAEIFAAAAMAAWQRGDLASAKAMVADALSKRPDQAGALMVDGALAWNQGDSDTALRRFSAAFERDPDDLYSAEKLAEVFDKQGVNREAALPYYIAIYRRQPDYSDGVPVEDTIRDILAARDVSGAGSSPEGLRRDLDSDDASARADACARAGRSGDSRWLDPLTARLDDDVDIVRRAARSALVSLARADPGALDERRKSLLSDPRPLVRAGALAVFAELNAPKTLPDVERALRDPDSAVRFFAHAVLQNRYQDGPDIARIRAEYLARETDPLVLARYGLAPRQPSAR